MVSQTPLNGAASTTLPRRDLVAIFQFLNRKGEDLRTDRDPYEHADGVLQQLAAAARMQ